MRVSYKARALGLAAALVALPLGAETAPASLTVDQAVAAALASNLGVRAAAVEARIKKRASDFSWNRFLPSVGISGTYARLNTVSPIMVGVAVPKAASATGYLPAMYEPSANNLMLGLTVQEVFSATYFGLMDQAAIDYQKSLISRAQAERSIAAAAKKIFYQILVQDQAIELTRARLDSAKERLRQAEVLYRLGQGTELNFMYATMGVESLQPDLRSMESGRAMALTAFQELLGYDPNPDTRLEGALEAEDLPVDPAAIVAEDRFDVRQSRQGERQLESALKIQRYVLLPNLILQYKADPMLNGPGDYSVLDTANWRQSQGALSITLSWSLDPLLPGSSIRVAKAELEDRLSIAREATAQTLRQARDEAVSQLRAIKDSVDKIEALKRTVAASKRIYELQTAAYSLGTGRILDLQDAEVAWQGTRIQLLNEKLKLVSLAFDLEAKYQGLELAKPAAPAQGAK
jgi:outer membrane protein